MLVPAISSSPCRRRKTTPWALPAQLNVDVNAFSAHAEHDVGDLPFVPEAKQLRVMLVQFHVRSLVEVADIIPFPYASCLCRSTKFPEEPS